MRALSIFLLVLATACGSVKDRGSCSASTDCAAGTYCAHTADGGVCWPDTVAPVVSSVAVSCATPCLRDGTMHVIADVTDDTEVLGADAIVGLATTVVVPMSWTGTRWAADVQLARYPFPEFERGVHVTVTGRDGARNTASMDAAELATVTRLRFQQVLAPGVALTSPAVMPDGTVVVAGANRTYFVAWDGAAVASVAVGALPITAAPLVLGSSVWIGSEDGRLYELTNPGSWQATMRCQTPARPLRGSLAVTSTGVVIAASDYGRLYSATSEGCKGIGPNVAPFMMGPVVDTSDGVYAAAATALRRFLLDVAGNIDPDNAFSATTLPWVASQPLAVNTAVFAPTSLGTTGRAYRAAATDLEPQLLATTWAPSGGYAILSDGSLLIPEQNETLAKWAASGGDQPLWRTVTLGGNPRTPLVMNVANASLVLSTDGGIVAVLRADGVMSWSAQLGAGAALQPGNLYTPPPAQQTAGTTLSTAYFAANDGYLYAVIVDGALDTSAPWPKAFHDPRNTNRAGPQP